MDTKEKTKIEAKQTYYRITANIAAKTKDGKDTIKKKTFWARSINIKNGTNIFQEVNTSGENKNAITILDKKDIIKIQIGDVSRKYGTLKITPLVNQIRKDR